jgi:hypothetical protein
VTIFVDDAYDAALAALTVPVSFVEWTTLRVDAPAAPDPTASTDWSPIAPTVEYKGDKYLWDPVQPIGGKRWIYVFARREFAAESVLPTLVEVLTVEPDGTISAATLGDRRFPDARPLDKKKGKEGKGEKDEGSPLPEHLSFNVLGKTMRFVRRWRGSRMVHFFFATRVPLSRTLVEKLRKNVHLWVPPTMFGNDDDIPHYEPHDWKAFGERDPSLVKGRGDGSLQVPVLDPLTIALNLHDLATGATDERRDYLTVYEGQDKSRRDATTKRQEKLLLALVLEAVVKDNKKAPSQVGPRVERFIKEYGEQVGYRVRQEETWWCYLSNWLQSDPIRFLVEAHAESGEEFPSKVGPVSGWMKFFAVMMTCLVGAGSTRCGRELLAAILKDKKGWDWLHREVLPETEGPEEDETAEKYQVPRKFMLAAFLGMSQFIPAVLHGGVGSTKNMWKVLRAQSKHFSVRFMIDHAELDVDPIQSAKRFEKTLQELHMDVPKAGEIIEEWDELTEHTRTEHSRAVTRFTMQGIVELIDLALSLHQFLQDHSLKKGATLVRSMADTAVALTEFAEIGHGKLLHTIFKAGRLFGVAASLIEGTMALHEAWTAFLKHDTVGQVGSGFVAGGAFVTGVAFGIGLFLTETPTPLVIAGLVLMGIGALINWFKDTPMETFLKNCAFGYDSDNIEVMDDLPKIKRGNYLGQLEILIQLLCLFKIEPVAEFAFRDAFFTMGWLPAGAKLDITVEEKLREISEPYHTKTMVAFKDGKPAGQFGKMRFSELDGEEHKFYVRPPHYGTDSELESITYTARLTIALGDKKFLVPREETAEMVRDAAAIRAAEQAQRNMSTHD